MLNLFIAAISSRKSDVGVCVNWHRGRADEVAHATTPATFGKWSNAESDKHGNGNGRPELNF